MALSRPGEGHLAMLAFSMLVAGSFSFGKRIATDIDPGVLTLMRFVIAAAVVGAVAARMRLLRVAVPAAPWRYFVLGGLLAIYFVTMFEGLKTASSVSTSAVFTLTPAMAALFGGLILGQRTTARIALALVLGGAGALWVIFDADLARLLAFQTGRGEAIFFVGCVAHGLYPVLSRRLNRGEPALIITLGMMLAAIGWLTLYAGRELAETDVAALAPKVWAVLVYLAVPASAATFFLLQYAALRLPAAKVMAYTYLVPSWVSLWEIALGAGLPPPGIVAGIALTVLALLLLLKEAEGPDRQERIGRSGAP